MIPVSALSNQQTSSSTCLPKLQRREEGERTTKSFRGDDSSGEYEPHLWIRTRQNDDTVTIEIEDYGPGIPDEIKDKILQPFFPTKKGTQGTGLGLSITNDIVKAHGGEISIESEPGYTCFMITILTE